MTSSFPIDRIRADFPILSRTIHGKSLAYLDNGATSQKPRAVIDAVSRFFSEENANIHRGVHYLSMQATDAYDRARERIAEAIGVAAAREVVFVRGATEAVNLVAHGLAERFQPGDEILLTVMEHHANLVPWQILAQNRGVILRHAPLTPEGEIDMDAYAALCGPKTRLAAFTHVSNALGTVNPVVEMTRLAKQCGALVLIDGAQAVPHFPLRIAELGCDFYLFSGHKVFGPDGIGVLWGKWNELKSLPPYQSGGDMIERVHLTHSTFREPPERFEAGTPHISGAIGLAAAFDYLAGVGWDAMHAYEQELLAYATERVGNLGGIRIIGQAREKVGVLSFTLATAHPHDIGTILDTEGVAIRAGNHCAQPLMEFLGLPGTARASFAFYNTRDEVDRLVQALEKVKRYFD
ncbi:MAG TPA: cysteine desulfurase [Verrucomicrobiales bacterium]|nr:cysteine desulfurase [Verrucomicrobiae bacterium]MCP5552962.1 cysteine desulfurase [Akkermansiaceae bacterium]HRX52855.1 cysteine desulfurase [Verrucomicrobiales bacterium]